jgi:hypothetical protein
MEIGKFGKLPMLRQLYEDVSPEQYTDDNAGKIHDIVESYLSLPSDGKDAMEELDKLYEELGNDDYAEAVMEAMKRVGRDLIEFAGRPENY